MYTSYKVEISSVLFKRAMINEMRKNSNIYYSPKNGNLNLINQNNYQKNECYSENVYHVTSNTNKSINA